LRGPFAFEKGFTEERRFILEASDGDHEMEVRPETIRLRLAAPAGLKLPAASGGPSIIENLIAWSREAGGASICKEKTIPNRSLTPGQAPGNARADRLTRSPGIAGDPRFRVAGFVDTGVPHLVLFLEDEAALETLDVAAAAPFYRRHPDFPRGTNVNFAARTSGGAIRVRTYERGVEGETLSCGTGCAAAALIASAEGSVSPPVAVRTKGGLLTVEFDPQWKNVILSGPAVTVFDGTLHPASWRFESCDAST
jgi:hypothetical protein